MFSFMVVEERVEVFCCDQVLPVGWDVISLIVEMGVGRMEDLLDCTD